MYNLAMDEYKNDKRIKIPEKFLQKLEDERVRTGCAGSKLLRGKKDVPKGINSAFINRMIRRRIQTAKPSHMQYIERLYAELPSTNYENNKLALNNRRRLKYLDEYVETDLELILKHKKRSGLTNKGILHLLEGYNTNLNIGKINTIISGQTRTVFKSDYDQLIKVMKNAPDFKPPPLKPVKQAKHKLQDGYIALTPSIMKKLQFYRSKQLLPHGIFKDIPYAPENPTPRQILVWFSGKNASISQSDWEFIKHHCEKALEAMEKRGAK